MPNIGPLEIIVILLILLVIFGPKRIPELGRSVGQGMRNFKDSVTGKDRGEPERELEAARTAPEAAEPLRSEPARSARSEAAPDEGTAARERPLPPEPTRGPRS
jgi:sec-independent protein translocase protein TatA